MDAAHVAELAAFVRDARGHAVKTVPPVEFVPEATIARGPLHDSIRAVYGLYGRYDRDKRTIVLADDLPKDEVDPVIVHELVHVLHHQRDLVLGTAHESVTDDLPFASLVEGDAELVEHAFRARRRGRRVERAMAGVTRVHDAIVPLWCRTSEASRRCALANSIYEDGKAFVSALYRAGGTALIDAAYAHPPTEMTHVLAPARYLEGAGLGDLHEIEHAAPGFERSSAHRYAFASTMSVGADDAMLRRLFGNIRGLEAATRDHAQLMLFDFDTAAAAQAMARFFNESEVRVVGRTRVVIGQGVGAELSEVVKRLAPASHPPAVAPRPRGALTVTSMSASVPWEELAASALRRGRGGFSDVGLVVPDGWRLEYMDNETRWTVNGTRVFIYPVSTFNAVDPRDINNLVGRAWAERVDTLRLEAGTSATLPSGDAQFVRGVADSMHFAIGVVSLCKSAVGGLAFVTFGLESSVGQTLKGLLGAIGPSMKGASVCDELAKE